jgi:hypothetical protein
MATTSRKSERRARQRLNAAALMARGEERRAQRLLDCVLQDERKEMTGYRTWSCQHRNCHYCGWKNSQKSSRRYVRKVEKTISSDDRLSFLTLTIPNVLAPSPQIYRWLSGCFKNLLHRDPFRGCVVGALVVIETVFNPDSQTYHIHLHAILIYTKCISQKEIAKAWHALTVSPPDGLDLPDAPGRVAWIKKIDPKTIRQMVSYLFKFKPIEDAEAYAEYDCAVKNVRLVQTYGAMRGRWRMPKP